MFKYYQKEVHIINPQGWTIEGAEYAYVVSQTLAHKSACNNNDVTLN